MLASIKKNKFVRHSIIILSLLLFTSCSWFTSNDDNEISFTITGKLTTNGAMPENYAQAMNARTALATAPSGQTIKYKVLLLAAEDDTEPVEGAVSEVASDGSSYSIKYTGSSNVEVQYYLRAVAYYMDGTNEVDVLLSPDTQLENAVNLKNGTFSQDLEMRPATSGYGEVSLAITLDSATMCDSVTISDESHFQVAKSGSNVTISHKATSADNPKLASGSYPVTVNFYKTVSGLSTPVLVYQFSDVINVFNNLTTNVWVDNGSSAVTSCVITTAMLEDFKTTNIYVDKRYDGEVYLGTYIQPYHSLKDAINFIEKTGNDKSTYTIHVKQVASTMFPDDLVLNSSIEVSKKISVEAYATVPGAKDGFYVIKSDESSDFPLFTVSNTGVLTFESNGAALDRSGFPTQGTKGIVLRTAFEGVQVRGRFNMKGGCITSCSNIAVEINSNGSVKTFEMTGGAITANSGKGVFVPDTGNFVVHGKPYIYGNGSTKTDLILNTGAVMSIKGPFATGALIGVRTQTAPTITSPVTITSGYGFQTGGYNAGVNPGKYFRSDNGDYGVTNDSMLTTPAGEAVLSPSGGNFSVGKSIDDLTISINKKYVMITDSEKAFSFTAKTKNAGGTEVSLAAGNGTGKISYDAVTLSYHGESIPSTSGSLNYYSLNSNKNQITFLNDLQAGNYTITINATYNGKSYRTDFDVDMFGDLNTTTFSVSDAVTILAGLTGENTLKVKGSDLTVLSNALKNGSYGSLMLNLDLSEVNATSIDNFTLVYVKSLVLPDTLTSIRYVLQNPYGNTMESYSISESNPNFSTLDGVVYNKNKTQLVLYPKNKKDTEFTLPSTVTSIGQGAFYMQSSLKKINGLSQIHNLSNVVFEWAYEIEEADLSGLTDSTLNSYMFRKNPKLQKVILSSSIIRLDYNIFDGCTGLTEVHFKTSSPPNLYRANDKPEFNECNSNLKFYVPTGSKEAYLAATGTNGFANSSCNYFADSLADRIIEE